MSAPVAPGPGARTHGAQAPLLVRTWDRPGALERLLGLVRRKAMKLDLRAVDREASGERWAVLLAPNAPDAPVERYLHELRGLLDVCEARSVDQGPSPSDRTSKEA